MSAVADSSERTPLRRRRRVGLGDTLFSGLALLAALASVVLVGLIAYKVADGSMPAIREFGLHFLGAKIWDPVKNNFGAASFIFGTAITSLIALLFAAPLAIAVALYVTELAPRFIRGPITALVETLAAIPTVVIGLWGILVLGPFLRDHVEGGLHRVLGFIPLFGAPGQAPSSLFTAIVVLTIMILPIVAAISRELFLSVPQELKEGALALGTTRWEMIRAVAIPYARGGIVAGMILGLGRAVGEAIAVTQVIGGSVYIGWNIFNPGDTLASRIASQYQGAATNLQVASLVYLALILLVFSLVANLVAQWIVRRFSRTHRPVSRRPATAGTVT